MRRFRLTIILIYSALCWSAANAQEPKTQGPVPSQPLPVQPQPNVTSPAPGQSAPANPSPPEANAKGPASADPQVTDPKLMQANLLEQLRRERDAAKAKEIANKIIGNWNDSGSATVDLLMQWANKAIAEKKNAAALDFLDEVTALNPNYIEGWNRRATLHYTMGDMRKSMTDINQVLQREPRHFPALAGMATILMENGQDELALKAWERFLSIYPAERDAQENVTKLSEKLAGSRT